MNKHYRKLTTKGSQNSILHLGLLGFWTCPLLSGTLSLLLEIREKEQTAESQKSWIMKTTTKIYDSIVTLKTVRLHWLNKSTANHQIQTASFNVEHIHKIYINNFYYILLLHIKQVFDLISFDSRHS
jgi:hypothetical protein